MQLCMEAHFHQGNEILNSFIIFGSRGTNQQQKNKHELFEVHYIIQYPRGKKPFKRLITKNK